MSIFCITDDKKSLVCKSSTNMHLSSSFLEYCVSIMISLSGPSLLAPHTLVLVAIVSLFSDTPNVAFLILLSFTSINGNCLNIYCNFRT